jgi:tetratricopeptide (TPR) repeat protein
VAIPVRPVRLALAGLCCAILLAAAVVGWWRLSESGRIAVASLPPRPDFHGFSGELPARVARCEFRVRYCMAPVSGLEALSRLYQANGFLEAAAGCYRGLIRLEPGDARWPSFLGVILSDYGDVDNAFPLLRRAVKLAPDYIPVRIRLADALLKTNQLDEAAAGYKAVLERAGENTYALLGLARCSMESGDWKSARDYLRRVTDVDPAFSAAWTLQSAVDEHFGDRTAASYDEERVKAGQNFRDCPDPWKDELWPDCYSSYLLRTAAAVANGAGDVNFALPLLRRAVQLGPGEAWNHRQLAQLLRDMKQYPEARTEMEACVALDPGTSDNWIDLFNLLRTMGDRDAAQRVLQEGLLRCPDSANLHYERGKQLRLAGHLEEALADFRLAQRYQPEEPKNYIESVVIYFRLGQLDRAAEELKAGLMIDPVNPELQTSYAFYEIKVGDEAGARVWLQKARENEKVTPDRLEFLAGAFRERFGSTPW